MSDRVRAGRGMDDRDVVRKSNPLQRAARGAAWKAAPADTDRMGREQQRRATAYGRARGRR